MKFRNLHKWDDATSSSGLVLFAQLFDEMLFDLSIDTYKPSVMTTATLCQEAITTIDQVEAGNIRPPNIGHVVKELVVNLEKDKVASDLLPLPVTGLHSVLKNPKASPRDLRCTLELMAGHLQLSKYRKRNEELLREVVKDGSNPSEVRRLSRNYLSTLLAAGFSHKHLHDATLDFFYYGKNRIAGPEAIGDFFDLLPTQSTKYSVIFKVDPVFKTASKAVQSLELTITEDISPHFDLAKFPSFVKPGDPHIFAVATGVRAPDPHSARDRGERVLKLISTMQALFHHQKTPAWIPESIVVDSKTEEMKKIGKHVNPMHRALDLRESTAKIMLHRFVRDFSLDEESFSKFVRSAQLHSMALESNSEENQILNLWISIESLIPSETKSDSDTTIEHVVNSVIPFLNGRYVEKLLRTAVRDLFGWDESRIGSVLKPIPGRRHWEKFAKLLALPEHASELAGLEASFRDFHLMRDRIDYLKRLLSSPASVKEALDAHKIRVEWQIRRIYRARNLIVHSGVTPEYTRSLIEHAHDYLDTVVNGLVKLASRPKTINSVAQGFKFAQLQYENYYKLLQVSGAVFSDSNIDRLLFGRSE